MINKNLLSLAIATAITAPLVAFSDTTSYGKAHVSINWFDINGTTLDGSGNYKGWTLNKGFIGKGVGHGNRIGIRGSEDFGGGLKAVYQIEIGIPIANENDYKMVNGDKGGIRMRNSYIGVRGNFGTFLVGRHDTPFKMSTSKLDLFNETINDYAGTLGFGDARVDNTIAYISPNVNGFQFAAAIVPGASSTFGGEKGNKSDGLAEAYSIAATYWNGPWYASAAYEEHGENMHGENFNTNPADLRKCRVGLGIRDLHGLYLSAIYENQTSKDYIEEVNDEDNDTDLWQGQIGYAFGNNMFKGSYGRNTPNVGYKLTSWSLGVDHTFSKRTKAYALYTKTDEYRLIGDAGDWNGFSVGMIHRF